MGLYGQLAKAYHWTPEQIDEQDIEEVFTMLSVSNRIQEANKDGKQETRRRVYADEWRW